MQITFTIPGDAIGKGRPKFARRGKFVTAYTPAKTVNYENLVKMYACDAMGDNLPFSGAVSVELMIFVMPPLSWSKKKRLASLDGIYYPTTKPDLDNIVKCVFDACNGIIYADDKQIVDCKISKRYCEKPGVIVFFSTLMEQ